MRTMLGGRRFKIIREVKAGDSTVIARRYGEDLQVTGEVFDAFEDAVKQGAHTAINGAQLEEKS